MTTLKKALNPQDKLEYFELLDLLKNVMGNIKILGEIGDQPGASRWMGEVTQMFKAFKNKFEVELDFSGNFVWAGPTGMTGPQCPAGPIGVAGSNGISGPQSGVSQSNWAVGTITVPPINPISVTVNGTSINNQEIHFHQLPVVPMTIITPNHKYTLTTAGEIIEIP